MRVAKLCRVLPVPMVKARCALHVIPKQPNPARTKVIGEADGLIATVPACVYSPWPLAQPVVVDALDVSQAERTKLASGINVLRPSFGDVSPLCNMPVSFPPLVIARIKDVCGINQLKAAVYDNQRPPFFLVAPVFGCTAVVGCEAWAAGDADDVTCSDARFATGK